MRRILRRVMSLGFVRRAALRLLLLRERLSSGASYNPLSAELHQSPYETYARLRENSPVHRTTLVRGWVLSRHADIDAVLRDHRRFSSDRRASPNFERRSQIGQMDQLLVEAGIEKVTRDNLRRAVEEPSLLGLDPPDHTRLRSLVNKAFTPKQVEMLRPRIEAVVDELLDAVEDGRVDMMEALANPLPTIVIAELIGVPIEDRERFKEWSDAVARTLEPTITHDEQIEALKANAGLWEYFDAIIEERRAEPRDDLLSALIAAEEEGDRLTRPEMISTLTLLLVAGNETTTNLIGNGLLALLRHPEQLARLRDNPDLMENAVEELLRYDGPVQTDGRTTTEDVVIGGQEIKAGQQLILLLGSANHDPEVFDEPDELDLGRDVRNHLGFARGNHYCLGAPLARAESQIAFERLIARFGSMSLAQEPVFKDHIILRGMNELWVNVESGTRAEHETAAATAT